MFLMAILDLVKLLSFFVEQSLRCSVTVMFRVDLCRILSNFVEKCRKGVVNLRMRWCERNKRILEMKPKVFYLVI